MIKIEKKIPNVVERLAKQIAKKTGEKKQIGMLKVRNENFRKKYVDALMKRIKRELKETIKKTIEWEAANYLDAQTATKQKVFTERLNALMEEKIIKFNNECLTLSEFVNKVIDATMSPEIFYKTVVERYGNKRDVVTKVVENYLDAIKTATQQVAECYLFGDRNRIANLIKEIRKFQENYSKEYGTYYNRAIKTLKSVFYRMPNEEGDPLKKAIEDIEMYLKSPTSPVYFEDIFKVSLLSTFILNEIESARKEEKKIEEEKKLE